ncbi:MAG: hypothetical protein H7X80_04165, partial [bacterium]|nr:hypothetical protein [Candidatus Kapabacteria bacterium]
MDNQERPLQDFFAAARSEPGITEHAVRTIVSGAGEPHRRGGAWRWVAGSLGVASIAIAIAVLADGSTDSDRAATSADNGVQRTASTSPTANTASTQAASAGTVTEMAAVPSAGGAASSNIKTTGAVGARPTSIARSNRTNQPTPITREERMNRKQLMTAMAAGAMALGVTDSADGQERKVERQRVKMNVELNASPVMDRMADELGREAADFWTAKLNGYKTRIDRILSPSDLDKLNRLRVRFGVVMAEHANINADVRTSKGERDMKHHTEIEEERIIINSDGTNADGNSDADGTKDKKVRREMIEIVQSFPD